MLVNEPIFLIGMGRSGTTVIFEALASHEDLGWFSNYSNKVFRFPQVCLIHRFFGILHGEKEQGQKTTIFNRFLPKPSEAYKTWEYLCGSKFRNTFLNDVNPTKEEIEETQKYVNQITIWSEKLRFAAKLTGPPRLKFLSLIFPDAFFIDVVRDPRAVVASLLDVKFWKSRGRYEPYWSGALNEEELQFWRKTGKSPVVLTSLQWTSVFYQTLKERREMNASYLRIKYEDFMEKPDVVMQKIISFLRLRESKSIKKYMHRVQYKNRNYKYAKRLSKPDIRLVEKITRVPMEILGYY